MRACAGGLRKERRQTQLLLCALGAMPHCCVSRSYQSVSLKFNGLCFALKIRWKNFPSRGLRSRHHICPITRKTRNQRGDSGTKKLRELLEKRCFRTCTHQHMRKDRFSSNSGNSFSPLSPLWLVVFRVMGQMWCLGRRLRRFPPSPSRRLASIPAALRKVAAPIL